VALVVCGLAWPCLAQDAGGQEQASAVEAHGVLDPLRAAYRRGVVIERVVLEATVAGGGTSRSQATIAIRTGESPALGLSLGEADPLRIFAEPGRILVWRESTRARVFLAPLAEPFGRETLERVLPPVFLPQIALAFGDSEASITPFVGETTWSRGESLLVGVSDAMSLTIRHAGSGRLSSYELRRDGAVLARGVVQPAEAAIDQAGWFSPPPLDGEIVESIAELARPARNLEPGQRFGDAIGVDSRRRPTTLRTLAEDAESVVVLSFDARRADARTRFVGALAEADLPRLATLLDATVLVLVIGDANTAGVMQRVVGSSGRITRRVRVMAIEDVPGWLPQTALSMDGVAFAVNGRAWLLEHTHPVAEGVSQRENSDPWSMIQDSSLAPRSLSERIAEAVGAAARHQR